MAVKNAILQEARNNAIDMLVTLIVDELAADLKMAPDEVFSRFVSSKTGQLLYDEESDLWWSGPSDIAELFTTEIYNSIHGGV